MAARSGSERDQMRRLMYVVVASSALASVASAEDRGQAAQAAHDVMRQAMLEHIAMPRDLPMRPDEVTPRGADASATAAAAHDHATRMRRSEAEQAAHSRAAAHGIRQPGAARREQERRPTGGASPMHGGSTGWDGGSDMGCGDAAGNSRNMDMHQWWNGGGGVPMGGWPMNLRATDPAGAGASTPATPTTR